MRKKFYKKGKLLLNLVLLVTLAMFMTSCATSRYGRTYGGTKSPAFGESGRDSNKGRGLPNYRAGYIKDNKPSLWISTHPRVREFYEYYNRTITVGKALERGQRYLPTIKRIFKQKRLPLELAFLPMLESVFINNADSGSARGMWQFTKQTAEHMGLKVGTFTDERLNWKKATIAAAEYLDMLGQKFNYNWALALAAYNGGPVYMEGKMKSQRTYDFFDLELRKETAEYVPKFVAMVQVAKEKFPHLLTAGR